MLAEALSLTESFQGYQGLSVSWLHVECSKLARMVFNSRVVQIFFSAILEVQEKDAYF